MHVGSEVAVEMMTHPFRYVGKMANMCGELGDGYRPIHLLEQFVGQVKSCVEFCNYSQIGQCVSDT